MKNIVDEEKPSIILVHNQNNTFSQSILRETIVNSLVQSWPFIKKLFPLHL
jgi:hypothetical protein